MVTAACTVERPGSSSPGGSAGATAPAASPATPARPCPWSEERGQEYEAETGRIRLVTTCLGEQHLEGGGGWAYGGPDQRGVREHRYPDGTAVAVICVEPDGARFADSADHASTVWFQVQGTFTGGDGTGWVPHAATGYARATGQDSCPAR
jgi:hypothetical protein